MKLYAGKILYVDLNSRKTWTEPLSADMAALYIGGIGINARLAADNIKPGADPLGDQNVLMFSPGAFVGTGVPTASRCDACAKSPLTNMLGSSNSGGLWPTMLKSAGYDSLVILGQADKPVYVIIHDDKVQIADAQHLWGLDTWQTVRRIRKELSDEEVPVISIGVAGENKVRYATIENGQFQGFGRTGLGAVMGSKQLKAIAVRGTGDVNVARWKEFLLASQDTRERIVNEISFDLTHKFGSMMVSNPYQELGALGGLNWQGRELTYWKNNMTREVMRRDHIIKNSACLNCPIGCIFWVEVRDGKHTGLRARGLEVTATFEFGGKCGINNLPAIISLSDLCHQCGIDFASSAESIAFAMELYEKGIIGSEETDNLELKWGDESCISQLVADIANRRSIGNLLAEGVKRAAAVIGKGSEKCGMHIKGLEMATRDPRAKWDVWSLGYLTNVRGGDHLRVRSPAETTKIPTLSYNKETLHRSTNVEMLDMLGDTKNAVFGVPPSVVKIPEMTKYSEELMTLINATGVCLRPPVLRAIGPNLVSRLLSSGSGEDISPEKVMEAAERILNLQHLFNIREGMKREDYNFPDRFFDEEIKEGPAKGKKLDRASVQRVLKEYFKVRGWDSETAIPGDDKLNDLGLRRI